MAPEEPSNSRPCLPDDIIFPILSRLPVKTLLRFCCVCKLWQNVITSDPVFIQSHLKQSLQDQAPRKIWMYNCIQGERCRCLQNSPDLYAPRVESADYQENMINLHNKFFYLGTKMELVGSSNGLLCFYKACGCRSDSIIYLWNPALHQLRLLPRSFRPDQWTIVVGFDFDPVTDDHKVVKVCGVRGLGYQSYKVEVYSLRNHSWTTITFSSIPRPPKPIGFFGHMGLIHDGSFYWIRGADEEGCAWLHVFDLTRNTIKVIVIPNYVSIRSCALRLFKGCLSICGYSTTTRSQFELWTMQKEYSSDHANKTTCYSWVKQFVIPKGHLGIVLLPGASTNVTQCGKVLGYHWVPMDGQRDRGHGLRHFVYFDPVSQRIYRRRGRRHFVYFDPVSERIEDVFKNGVPYYDVIPSEYNCDYFVVDNYVESLVSVIPPDDNEFAASEGTENDDTENDDTQKGEENVSCSRKLFGCFMCS